MKSGDMQFMRTSTYTQFEGVNRTLRGGFEQDGIIVNRCYCIFQSNPPNRLSASVEVTIPNLHTHSSPTRQNNPHNSSLSLKCPNAWELNLQYNPLISPNRRLPTPSNLQNNMILITNNLNTLLPPLRSLQSRTSVFFRRDLDSSCATSGA